MQGYPSGVLEAPTVLPLAQLDLVLTSVWNLVVSSSPVVTTVPTATRTIPFGPARCVLHWRSGITPRKMAVPISTLAVASNTEKTQQFVRNLQEALTKESPIDDTIDSKWSHLRDAVYNAAIAAYGRRSVRVQIGMRPTGGNGACDWGKEEGPSGLQGVALPWYTGSTQDNQEICPTNCPPTVLTHIG